MHQIAKQGAPMAPDDPPDGASSGWPMATPAAPVDQVDPHLELIREAMQGQRRITFILVVAILFGQSVTAILSGASLAAELGAFRVYSTDSDRNAAAVEHVEHVDAGDVPPELDP